MELRVYDHQVLSSDAHADVGAVDADVLQHPLLAAELQRELSAVEDEVVLFELLDWSTEKGDNGTYQNRVTVVTILTGHSNVVRVVRHVKDDIGQLRRLTDGPVQQGNVLRRVDARRVDDDVLDGDVKVHRALLVRVLAVDDVVVGEVGGGLENGRVDRVAHEHGAHVQLKTARHQVRSGWDVHDGWLAGRSHRVGGPRRAVRCSSWVALAAYGQTKVTDMGITIDSILDGSRRILGTSVVGPKVSDDISEDNVVVLVGRVHVGSLAVVGDGFIPPLRGVVRGERGAACFGSVHRMGGWL